RRCKAGHVDLDREIKQELINQNNKTKIRSSWNSARRSSVRHRATTLDFVRWNPNTGVVQPALTFVSRLSKHVKTLSMRVLANQNVKKMLVFVTN
ncbi:hypothetical protein ALC60_04161, partial [Trachymyrmex zeteki]